MLPIFALVCFWVFVFTCIDNPALKILAVCGGLLLPGAPYVLGCLIVAYLIFLVLSRSFKSYFDQTEKLIAKDDENGKF